MALAAASSIALAEDDPTRVRDTRVPTRTERKHVTTSNSAVIGIVEKMTGPCYAIQGGAGGKKGIAIGLRVFEKDALVTDDMSRLHVRYKDGTYVEMGGSTQFQVEKVRFKPANPLPSNSAQDQLDESLFYFDHGLARVTAPEVHSLERFAIRTQTAMVRITGPADFYLIQLEGDRDLAVKVMRGNVEIMNLVTNESMRVKEQTGAFVRVSGSVSTSGSFGADQVEFLKSRTRI